MVEQEQRNDALNFIVSALSAGWSFGDVDAAVLRDFPMLQGAELMETYRKTRDRLLRMGWIYPYRGRSGPVPKHWGAMMSDDRDGGRVTLNRNLGGNRRRGRDKLPLTLR
jgi:hypothetical protein